MNYITKSLLSIFVLSIFLFGAMSSVNAAAFKCPADKVCTNFNMVYDNSYEVQHTETVDIKFDVVNEGGVGGAISFELPENSNYYSVINAFQEINSLLPNGIHKTVTLTVKINDSTQTNSFTIPVTAKYAFYIDTINGKLTPVFKTETKNVTFTIKDKAAKLNVTATPNYNVAHGQSVDVVFKATNSGNLSGTVKVDLITNNSYFTANDYSTTVTVEPNSTKDVFFTINVNDTTPNNNFTVSADVVTSYTNLETEYVDDSKTINLNFNIVDSANISVSAEQLNYYVQHGETLDVKFFAENQGNLDGFVTIQLQPDEDDEDYFTSESTSKTQDVATNTEEEIKFKLKINEDTPSDEYTVPFKVLKYITDAQGETQQTSSIIKITLHINDYDPVDVKFEDDVVCANTGETFTTNLVFTNEGSKTYYILPKLKSEDLWPKVKSDIIEINEDIDTKVEVTFNKIPMIGEYKVKLEQDLYESKLYTNAKYFEKFLTVKVANCKSEFVNLFVNNDSISVKQGEKGTISFDLINTTGTSMPVSISAESDDPTLNVVVDNTDAVLSTGFDYVGHIYVYPTDYTSAGIKTVTVKATTPYSTETDSASIVVVKSGLNVTANPVEIPVGTKGAQTVSLQNNTGTKLSLNIYTIGEGSDIVTANTNAITLNAGETKTVTVGIVPKTLGAKKYTLQITGGFTLSKELFYGSNTSTTPSSFVVSYTANAETILGKTVLLPITLSNPYDSTITATIKFKGAEGVTSKIAYVVLNPKTQTSTTLEYTAYTAGTLKPTLEVSTELGVENYPVTLKVKADASSANVLEIQDMPTEIPFVNGNEVTISFKVSNPNAFEVKGNTLRLTLEDGTVVGEKTFNIGSNAEKDVTVKFTVESDEETTGTVSLISGVSENEYTVDFVKDSSFGNAGLFGLGFGGTLGIILGIVIVVLIILYFSLRGNEATSA